MAHEVTLKQLSDWIEKNKHRTWNHDYHFGPEKKGETTFEMKYIRFNLDTRDMRIFAIQTDGFGELKVDFREDDKDWTILDLLEFKLDQRRKK